MRVLWVTNVPPAAASGLLEQPSNPFGGWLDGSLGALSDTPGLDINIAFPHGESPTQVGTAGRVTYWGFAPCNRRRADGEGRGAAISLIRAIDPDLVHIHGTEMPHSLSFALAAGELDVPAVISLQGLVSVLATHSRADLPLGVVHAPGRRPWVRSERVSGQQRAFELQGRLERRALRAVKHVIGRTTWDRVTSTGINPSLRYHHCDETLRPSFYGAAHEPSAALPHSVVVGQGHYPVKGLHLLIEALPAVVAAYPSTTVAVAGQSPASTDTPYGRYLLRQLRTGGLEDRLRFTGPLDEGGMLDLYRASAVVACPSVMENSPNSVAEGMLLGMPVVASYVGGVPDMITHQVDGLAYQADAPYMLANALVTLFSDRELRGLLGARARQRARARHDPAVNAGRTVEIYKRILSERPC